MLTTLIASAVLALSPISGDVPDTPSTPPPCDQPAATSCTWDVEVDGVMQTVKGCAEEDGNTDGRPCMWIDPDTGRGFYVDSANYR